MSSYVLALDQGTTSSRAIIFDRAGNLVSTASREFPQIFPRPGWVEHDPEQIWSSQLGAVRDCLKSSTVSIDEIAAIGITNQRETAVVWDRETGEPVYNAIVWQSRQSEKICADLRDRGHEDLYKARTGLVVDPYFSGTKIRWILDHVEGAQARAERGELAFGTVDTWLIYRLTGGRVHATDYSNASRTLLFNIDTLSWDPELLEHLKVPASMLPEVRESSGSFGATVPDLLGRSLPITGVAGDQQAALFGQGCFEAGSIKNTYGTGCFALMNTGSTRPHSEHGLLSTIAWSVRGRVDYALEGSVFVAGAAIQWLRDQLGLIETAAQSESVASSVESTEGVFLVPAFTGLGAPYWDSRARGILVGLTRGSGRAHVVRAALESIAFQSVDVIRCFEQDSGQKTQRLQVDGGATSNDLLMQFQADILGVPVSRPTVVETTALGAAYLAGLSQGVWDSFDDVRRNWQQDRLFEPRLTESERQDLYTQWLAAVQRARS